MKRAFLVLFVLIFSASTLATNLGSFSSWHSVDLTGSLSAGSTIASDATFSDRSLVPKLQQSMLVFLDANTVDGEINVDNCVLIPNSGVGDESYRARNPVVVEQPSLETSASYNGWPFCRFDGVDDKLVSSFLSPTIAQPFRVCFVTQGFIGSLTSAMWFNRLSGPNLSGGLLSGTWTSNAGATISGGTVSSTDVYAACYFYDGVTSEIEVSGSLVASGNAGSSDLTGITIFSRSGGGYNMRASLLMFAIYNDDLGPLVNADWLEFSIARYGPMDTPPSPPSCTADPCAVLGDCHPLCNSCALGTCSLAPPVCTPDPCVTILDCSTSCLSCTGGSCSTSPPGSCLMDPCTNIFDCDPSCSLCDNPSGFPMAGTCIP